MSKPDIEKVAKAIGRARKRLPVGEVSRKSAEEAFPRGAFGFGEVKVPPAWGDSDLFIEYMAEEIAAEFPEATARLGADKSGSAEQIETLIDVERMT